MVNPESTAPSPRRSGLCALYSFSSVPTGITFIRIGPDYRGASKINVVIV